MGFIFRQVFVIMMVFTLAHTARADDTYSATYTDLDLSIEQIDSSLLLADNRAPRTPSSVPNIPDSAFKKPMFTGNNAHMYLGLASMALGGLAAISAPDGYDPDLLNSVHFRAARLSWQMGAAALGTGLYYHWDDFHIEDGLFDRDNLHVILGTLGVIGYYFAVQDAVNEYNSANNTGYPSTNHSSAGTFGGAAMLTAIALTW